MLLTSSKVHLYLCYFKFFCFTILCYFFNVESCPAQMLHPPAVICELEKCAAFYLTSYPHHFAKNFLLHK